MIKTLKAIPSTHKFQLIPKLISWAGLNPTNLKLLRLI